MLRVLGLLSWLAPALGGAWLHRRFAPEEPGLRGTAKHAVLWLLAVNSLVFLVTVYVFDYRAGVLDSLCTLPSFILKYAVVGIAVTGAGLAALYLWPRRIRPFLARYGMQDLPPLPRRARLPVCLAAAAMLFVPNALRLFDNCVWSDEGFTIVISRMPLSDMLRATASDVHPPLYYLFTMAANRLFGDAGWAYHGVSLLAYAGLMLFALTWFRRRYGVGPCLVFMAMISLMPQAFYYNVEVRMYAQAALFVCLSFAFFHNILEKARPADYAGFAFASLCAAYTHYYALITVAFLYLALLLMAAKGRLRWKPVLIVCVATVAVYLPWFVVLLRTFSRVSDSYWITECPSVRQSLAFVFDMDSARASAAVQGCFVLLLTAALAREIRVIAGKNGRLRYDSSDRAVCLLAALAALLGTILTGILVSVLVRPVFVLRYLHPAGVMTWLVLAALLNRAPARRLLCVGLAGLVLLVQIPAGLATYREEKSRDQHLAQTLQDVRADADTVLLTDSPSFNGTLLPVYYPDTERILLQPGQDLELDPEKTYILFFIEEISDDCRSWLAEQGLRCDDTPCQGWMANAPAYIYQTELNKTAGTD